MSVWSTLKSLIGQDLTTATLPVSFNEPTTLLQRMAEDLEYAELLNTAVQPPLSSERMVYVAVFAASIYASTLGRTSKPFNPLLGETYEYTCSETRYRFFSEQVSHNPPVSAI